MGRAVGIRELKANPGKYVRLVKDEHEEIDITIRGEIVARLVPVKRKPTPEDLAEYWRQHRELAQRLSASLPPGEVFDAVEAVREQRRDL